MRGEDGQRERVFGNYEDGRASVGLQRWIVGAYDKRIAWADWVAANYEPRNL